MDLVEIQTTAASDLVIVNVLKRLSTGNICGRPAHIILEPRIEFRAALPGMGGTYRSVRLPIRGPPATGRYRQKSIVDGRLRDIGDGEKGKKKKKRRRNRTSTATAR
ncbi:hypothetical protein BHE74_00031125 [Ensete ventricosum]|nr:hypothetical protein BHE74_00031125 [Ensete ventricosum]